MTRTLTAMIALAAAATPALADEQSLLSLDLARGYEQPDPGAAVAPATAGEPDPLLRPAAEPAKPAERERRFGRAGSRWWSIGSGIANDFSGDTDINLHGIFSLFLADGMEFGIEGAGWYFNQEGKDTGGVSGSMIFRWHFWHWDEQFRWGGGPKEESYRNTFFLDAGIGLLGSFDDVPEGGTSLNFLPRLGAGYTHALSDDEAGTRLTLGLRWHHISNARIEGNDRNPARDSLMFYAEVQFGF